MSNQQKPEHLVKLQVIEPKSVLNPSGMGGFTLNPYAGCTVGCAYCLEGDTLITMADNTTKPMKDVLIGEDIVGVRREDHQSGVWSYRYTQATILNKIETLKEAFEIVLANGNRVICSGDHRWLTNRGWKYTTGEMQGVGRRPYLTINHFIQGIGQAQQTPRETKEYQKGYLAGMIRGDGLLARYDYSGRYKGHNRKYAQTNDIQHQFRLALSDFEALKRTSEYLRNFGVETIEVAFDNRRGHKPMRAIRNHSRTAFETITALVADGDSGEWLRGWLAGIFDAEGSFSQVIRISNTNEQMLRITLAAFAALDLRAVREDRTDAASSIRLCGGLSEVTRFFQKTAPAISRKCNINETTLRKPTRIVEIRPLGTILPMIDLTTSTENFIANGLVSHNCYVPHMRHNQREARKWGAYVDIKAGAVELLDRQLARLRKPATIFMSTATDPYQPLEERHQITRRMLEVFGRHPQHALFILTKQALVERDVDLLVRLPRVAVGLSIAVIEDRLAALLEPWAPVTSERLAIIERLSGQGIPTYLLWAPAIVPLPMSEAFIRSSVEAIARTGTGALSLDTLNYRASQSAGLFRRLRREGHLAANKAQVKLIRQEADRLGIGRRLEMVGPAQVDEMTPLLPF